jgi:hypothetical protein
VLQDETRRAVLKEMLFGGSCTSDDDRQAEADVELPAHLYTLHILAIAGVQKTAIASARLYRNMYCGTYPKLTPYIENISAPILPPVEPMVWTYSLECLWKRHLLPSYLNHSSRAATDELLNVWPALMVMARCAIRKDDPQFGVTAERCRSSLNAYLIKESHPRSCLRQDRRRQHAFSEHLLVLL